MELSASSKRCSSTSARAYSASVGAVFLRSVSARSARLRSRVTFKMNLTLRRGADGVFARLEHLWRERLSIATNRKLRLRGHHKPRPYAEDVSAAKRGAHPTAARVTTPRTVHRMGERSALCQAQKSPRIPCKPRFPIPDSSGRPRAGSSEGHGGILQFRFPFAPLLPRALKPTFASVHLRL